MATVTSSPSTQKTTTTSSSSSSMTAGAATTSTSKLAEDDYYRVKPREKLMFMKPIDLPAWDAHSPQAVIVFESLIKNNFAILDNFIDPVEARQLRDEVKKMYDDGRMTDGKIGMNIAGNQGDFRPEMRTDKMVWLEGNEPFVEKTFRRHIMRADIFAQKINLLCQALSPENQWEGFSRCKIMATCYPKGGKRYVAHYDNPNRNGRKVTIILYLNEFWKEGDGGVLRAKTNGVQIDVAPLFNRLFVFWSDRRVPHEVLPTAEGKDRFAITIWYMDDKEKALGPLPHAS